MDLKTQWRAREDCGNSLDSLRREDMAYRPGSKTADADPVRSAVCPCSESCPIGDAVRMVGGRWKMRVLCTLTVDGTQRYNDLKKKTVGITPAVLSSVMKDLERDGLVTRVQYDEIPPRVEYTITEYGRQLWPILHHLAHWARHEEAEQDTESWQT